MANEQCTAQHGAAGNASMLLANEWRQLLRALLWRVMDMGCAVGAIAAVLLLGAAASTFT